MAAPAFVPAPVVDTARSYSSPHVVPASWSPDRPGDIVGFQPAGERLGYQGPDQGFALKIANGFKDRLHLQPGEHDTDVLFRIDDELVPVRSLMRALHPAAISRIKVLGVASRQRSDS